MSEEEETHLALHDTSHGHRYKWGSTYRMEDDAFVVLLYCECGNVVANVMSVGDAMDEDEDEGKQNDG